MAFSDLVTQVLNEKRNEEKKGNFALILLRDLIKLHDDCDFCLSYSDDKILNYLCEILKNTKSIDDAEFNKFRVELYYHYATELNKELNDFSNELSIGLVNIDSTYSLINSCNRKLDKIERSIRLNTTETLKELSEIINSLIEEYNRLIDEETELKKRGRDKFLGFLLPVLTIASGVFGVILYKTDLILKNTLHIILVLLIYIIYLIAISWVFKHIYLRIK
jgi:hypothetical protein